MASKVITNKAGIKISIVEHGALINLKLIEKLINFILC